MKYAGWIFILLGILVLVGTLLYAGHFSQQRQDMRNEKDQRFLACVLMKEDLAHCRVA